MSAPSTSRSPIALRVVVFLLVTTVIFILLGGYGARQAEQGVRVLGELEPIIELNRVSGATLINGLMAYGSALAAACSMLALFLVALAFVTQGRRAWPLLLLGASVALLVWAQVWFWVDQPIYPYVAYPGAMLLAVALGAYWPVQWEADADDAAPLPWWEVGLLIGLCTVAMLTRLYALTELPSFFVGEMAVEMLGSRTWVGIGRYIQEGLVGSSIGIMHLVPQMVFYKWLGTSIYSLRLSAVAMGVLCIPLLYWLLRRLSTRRAALIGAVLMLTGPEQLWFSRDENTNFQAITILSLISAHLAVTMVRRFSWRSVLANALWMPFTRLFYLAGVTLMVYPAILAAHALLFARGTWRKLWYIVPLFVAAVFLWFYSLTLVNYAVTFGEWRFLNPAFHGEAIMNRDPALKVSPLVVAREGLESLAANLGVVLNGAVHHGGFSHWYQRFDDTRSITVYNCAVVGLLALAIGYLLGQFYNRFAFALLAWLGLGLLPAILSTSPVERRMSVIFAAANAISAIGLDAFLRLGRERGGRFASMLLNGIALLLVAGLGWTNLASHFRLRTTTLGYDTVLRFSKAIFESSDVVFHNVDGTMAMMFGFGSADQLAERETSPCYRYVNPSDILQAALAPQCTFHDATFIYLISDAEIVTRSAAFQPPNRVSFLLDGHEVVRGPVELLKVVFPDATITETKPDNEELDFVAVQLTRPMIDARRTAKMSQRPDTTLAADAVLRGGRVDVGDPLPADSAASAVVQAGAFITREGWYHFQVDPPCAEATIRIDGQDVSDASTSLPLLHGVHPLEIVLNDAKACRLPLGIFTIADDDTPTGHREALLLTAPDLAALPATRAKGSKAIDSYGPILIGDGIKRVVDVARAPDGKLLVLGYEGEGSWIYQLSPDLTVERRTQLKMPYGMLANTILPIGDRIVVYSLQKLLIFDTDGNLQTTVEDPPVVGSHNYISFPDGHILSALPHHASVALVDLNGRIIQEFSTFSENGQRFFEPISLALSPSGDLVVIQTNHIAHLFHDFVGTRKLNYVRSFELDLTTPAVSPLGVDFDGDHRILVSDPGTNRVVVYDTEGNRLMAPRRSLDLGQRGMHEILRLRVLGDRLYYTDGTRVAAIPIDHSK